MALTDTKILGAEAPEKPVAEVAAVEEAKPAQAEVAPEIHEDFDPALLGSDSGKWAYVAAITDATVTDKNVIKDAKTGEKTEITTGKFIGYVFKALENGLEYPQTEITPFYLRNPFKVTGEVKTAKAKKGQEVILTIPEALAILSDPKVNGVINGNDVTVTAVYTEPKRGVNAKDDVLPVKGYLKPGKGAPSLKELQIREGVLGESRPNPNNATIPIVDRYPAKGFERFAPACEKAPRKAGSGASTASAEDSYKATRNRKAQAFAAAFNARRA